jgi:hypothetical protein
MERNEILEKNRKDNKGNDEYENSVLNSSGRIAAGVGGLLCGIFLILDIVFKGEPNLAYWTIWSSIEASLFIIKYKKLRKKHELLLAVLYTLLAVMSTATYILILTGIMK